MAAGRLQAPNYWASFIPPQKPGKSPPSKQFLKIHRFPTALICHHATRRLWPMSRRYWQAFAVQHRMRPGLCFRSKPHRDPRLADSRLLLDPNEHSTLPLYSGVMAMGLSHMGHAEHPALGLRVTHFCDSWTRGCITVQHTWHTVLMTPHLINSIVKNHHN